MLPPSAPAYKIPVSLEAVIADTYHITVFKLCLTVIPAVRHNQAKENLIPRLFGNPFQCLFITLCPVVLFVIFQKIYSQIFCTEVNEMADIPFHPLLGSRFVHIHPVQFSVESMITGNLPRRDASGALYGTIFRVCRACEPEWIVINTGLHALGLYVIVPIAEVMHPAAVVFRDITVGIDSLRRLYPSVITDHIISVIPESFRHPVDVVFPAEFRHRLVQIIAIFVCYPVFRTCPVAGVSAVPCTGKHRCKRQQQ